MRFIPYAKRWNVKKKKIYIKHITSFIEQILSASQFFKVIFIWNEKCRFLQKQLKFCIRERKKNYANFIARWNKAECNLFLKKKKNKLDHLISIQKQLNTDGATLIPLEIKNIYIRQLLKKKLHLYANAIKAYKKNCKEIDLLNQHRKWEIEIMNVQALKYPEKPKINFSTDLITEEELFQLIHSAQKDRLDWENLINTEKQKNCKSYYKNN